ncbi:MAG TPA: hypothetical protein VG845_09975 [Dehalococcoidia bacterium]|jgi:hypothetical protein|nr:hypothetical protein [Dehalococcoidia bacterium]
MRRRRRRYARLRPPPDLWADLGPGDPGYRLRPGRTGFDPFETYQEYARVFGMLLKAVIVGDLGRYPLASLVVLFALLHVFFLAPWDLLALLFRVQLSLTTLVLGSIFIFAGALAWLLIRRILRR